ncbi:type II toxin-antitoxin system VapC family toxin [Phytoactinopolyspora halophila]|nr:type II toxin-antitoxin system VapC family toxin [Phytoactinopolyspora halophila]
MSFVVDASALMYANIANEDAAARLRNRLRDETVHAPHLIDAELGNVLRRQVMRGTMTADHGAAVLRHAPRLIDHRYDHTGSIATAAWALRENVTFYDAIYVALAAALDVPLMTADQRLSTAPRLPCALETP